MNDIIEKFKYLVEKAKYFEKLKSDENFLFEEIIKIPLSYIQKVKDTYANEKKIKEVRYKTAELLLDNKFNKEKFEQLKVEINDKYDTNIFQSWKNFSILYVFFFNPIKKEVNEYLKDIGKFFINQSSTKFKLKTTSFDGAQNFGEVGCWLALYNPKYKSQSEGIQYFINFYNENTTYGTYEYSTQKDINRYKYDIKNVDDSLIQKIIDDIKLQKNIIMEENIISKNYKDQYIDWMNKTSSRENSNKLTSYVTAIDILSGILSYNIFETSDKVKLNLLYKDLIKEQKNINGKYYYENAPSYGSNGFYSASIKSYIYFLNSLEKTPSKNKDLTMPLNQILYGPPGTSKTYYTINETIKIIDNDFYEENKYNEDFRKLLKEKFEEYKKAGQIEFVTFHQSYGYEEFVEGIKAIPSGKEGNENGEEMIYDVMPGIFKKICIDAKRSTKIDTVKQKRKFLLNAKSLNIQAEMIEDNESSYRVLKGSKIRKGEADSFHKYNYVNLKKKVLETAKYIEEDEFYLLEEDFIFQSMSAASSVILGRQSNGYNDWKEILEDDLFSRNIKKNEKNIAMNYVLIIDEINRGNISKIFGELITLIEDSKRLGADESVEVTLPYSGDKFSVPQNLYILGTMNTADRSIALMDTALRRRFIFKEMMPQPSFLSQIDIDGINIENLLTTINERVDYLYDRDHTIGHAYFMSLKNLDDNAAMIELDNIFRNKIIPLLQEYFYDDWEKIQIVLGDHPQQKADSIDKFIIEVKQEEVKILGFNHEDIDDEQYNYTINELFTKEAYLKLSKRDY